MFPTFFFFYIRMRFSCLSIKFPYVPNSKDGKIYAYTVADLQGGQQLDSRIQLGIILRIPH